MISDWLSYQLSGTILLSSSGGIPPLVLRTVDQHSTTSQAQATNKQAKTKKKTKTRKNTIQNSKLLIVLVTAISLLFFIFQTYIYRMQVNKTISSVKLLSCVQLFATQWAAACQASLAITNSWTYSNSCPSCRQCHPSISSSIVPFSSRLQSFRATGSFPMSQFLASGGQSTGVSASTSVLPMNTQD